MARFPGPCEIPQPVRIAPRQQYPPVNQTPSPEPEMTADPLVPLPVSHTKPPCERPARVPPGKDGSESQMPTSRAQPIAGFERRQLRQIHHLRPSRQVLPHGGWNPVQGSVAEKLQRPDTRGRVKLSVDGLGRRQTSWHIDTVGHQRVDVHVILPTAPNLNHTHFHAGKIHKRSNLNQRSHCPARILNPLESVEPAKES